MSMHAAMESLGRAADGAASHGVDRLREGLALLATGVNLVEMLCFWVAVVLPVTYLPMALAVEFASLSADAFVGVVGVNALALVLGHHHDPGRPGSERPRRRDRR